MVKEIKKGEFVERDGDIREQKKRRGRHLKSGQNQETKRIEKN